MIFMHLFSDFTRYWSLVHDSYSIRSLLESHRCQCLGAAIAVSPPLPVPPLPPLPVGPLGATEGEMVDVFCNTSTSCSVITRGNGATIIKLGITTANIEDANVPQKLG